MGVKNLLPMMDKAGKDVSLSKLQGTVAAVDTNVWIHRACYSCADKIYLNEPTDMFVNYCMKNVELLRKNQISPLLVFDGQSLPAKAQTKLERKKRKDKIREQIEDLRSSGQEGQARWLMRQCVDVTFEMVRKVIERCRIEHVDYIVAPYEADAQITYLVNENLADYAISEDSDLLTFGCRRVLYKLDRETGRGRMIDMDHLDRCFKSNFDLKRFQYMCILSGCDYLANIPNVAIGRAKRFFEDPTISIDGDPGIFLKRLPSALKMSGKIKIPDGYAEDFIKAYNTFRHQLVYSPHQEKLTHLNNLTKNGPKHNDLKEYVGDFFDPKLENYVKNNLKFIKNYILGNVCTKTLNVLDDYYPIEDVWNSLILQERIQLKQEFFDERILKLFTNDEIHPEKSPKKIVVEEEEEKEDERNGKEQKSSRPLSRKSRSLIKESENLETEKLFDQIKSMMHQQADTGSTNFTTLKPSSSNKQQQRKTRNSFLSPSSQSNSTKSKSKYFTSNDDDDEWDDIVDEELNILNEPKAKKQKTLNELDTSYSSLIDEEEEKILLSLNTKSQRSNESFRKFTHQDSLCSDSDNISTQQSSQQSTNSDEHYNDHDDDDLGILQSNHVFTRSLSSTTSSTPKSKNFQKQKSTSTSSNSTKRKRKSSRQNNNKHNNNDDNNDIRNYLTN